MHTFGIHFGSTVTIEPSGILLNNDGISTPFLTILCASQYDLSAYVFTEVSSIAENKMDILGHLIAILETDEIDLVVLNTADLPLVMNIVKTKKIIVDKDPFSRHVFESLTMRKYFDFSIKEAAILQRRYLHG